MRLFQWKLEAVTVGLSGCHRSATDSALRPSERSTARTGQRGAAEMGAKQDRVKATRSKPREPRGLGSMKDVAGMTHETHDLCS